MSDFDRVFLGFRGRGLRQAAGISFATAMCLALPTDAYAYIGPGAGISAIGSLLALLGAVFLAIVGFLWYPIKRLVKRKKPVSQTKTEPEAEQT